MRTLILPSIAAALAATGIFHLRSIYYSTYHIPLPQISGTNTIPSSLATSVAVKITNPHNHIPIHDTRNATISVPKSLSHEAILAHFVKGFFGGHVFGIERGALRAGRKEITGFEALRDTQISRHIWSKDELSIHALPPLHGMLFGAFWVVDVRLEEEERVGRKASTPGQSYVDFAFGSDDGWIAGVHRFSVTRGEEIGKEEQNVTIEFAHAGCNPREDKPLKPEFIQTLHMWYAMWLFREGVGAVVKG